MELRRAQDFDPPPGWLRLTTLDAHAAGEPLRIVTGGWPDVPGDTMLAKRRFAREHHDHLRRALMWEPRGHADMYGAVPTAPVTAPMTVFTQAFVDDRTGPTGQILASNVVAITLAP